LRLERASVASARAQHSAGQSLKLNIIGSAPLTVTKISDDPDVPLTEARTLAVCLGARPGF